MESCRGVFMPVRRGIFFVSRMGLAEQPLIFRELAQKVDNNALVPGSGAADLDGAQTATLALM